MIFFIVVTTTRRSKSTSKTIHSETSFESDFPAFLCLEIPVNLSSELLRNVSKHCVAPVSRVSGEVPERLNS